MMTLHRSVRLLAALVVTATILYLVAYAAVALLPALAMFAVFRRAYPAAGRGRRGHGGGALALDAGLGAALGGLIERRLASRDVRALSTRERNELERLRSWFEREYGEVPF